MASKRFTVRNCEATTNYNLSSEANRKLVDEYVMYMETMDKSPQTIRVYLDVLKEFVTWIHDYNNDKYFIDFKRRDLVNYFTFLRITCGVSSKRIGVVKSVLNGFSTHIEVMYEDEYPNYRNLVRGLDVGKTTSRIREDTVLTDEQIQEMLDKLVELKQYDLACFLSLLANSGMRISELDQLTLDDFTPEHVVHNGNLYLTHKIRTKGAGKEGKVLQRYVIKEPFDPYLQLWINYRNEHGMSECRALFPKRNKCYKERDMVKGIRLQHYSVRIRKIFNIEFYAHCVRHYFTTRLQRLEMPNELIKEWMRWESVNMVDVYSDIDHSEKLQNLLESGQLFKAAE